MLILALFSMALFEECRNLGGAVATCVHFPDRGMSETCRSSGSGPDPGGGSFGYTVERRSSVIIDQSTYAGRLIVSLSRRLGNVDFVLQGTEQCGGRDITGWDTNYTFTDWGSVNLMKGASFDGNPLDCGAFLVSHTLTWNYAWALANPGTADVIGTYSDTCNLKDSGCAAYYGSP